MGTCASNCCFESASPTPVPSISDPESPHDKAVIHSETRSATITTDPLKDAFTESPKNHTKLQIHPCPPATSSSSTTSTTTASSSLSTSTITTSNTSSYSTANSSSYSTDNSDSKRPPLKKKSFSNEFLLSCVENSNIVILDPTKGIKEKTVEAQFEKFSEFPITPSQYLSVTTRGVTASTLRQRTNTSMRDNQSYNAKRSRSVSPASRSTGRKVIKPDLGLWNPVSSDITRPRTGDIQPPQWRPINSQRGSSSTLTGPVSRPVSAIKKDLKGPTMETERQMQDGDVISRERVKSPPPLVEDLNNPLIAMDCFIFL